MTLFKCTEHGTDFGPSDCFQCNKLRPRCPVATFANNMGRMMVALRLGRSENATERLMGEIIFESTLAT
jgi:hypothetical protein